MFLRIKIGLVFILKENGQDFDAQGFQTKPSKSESWKQLLEFHQKLVCKDRWGEHIAKGLLQQYAEDNFYPWLEDPLQKESPPLFFQQIRKDLLSHMKENCPDVYQKLEGLPGNLTK